MDEDQNVEICPICKKIVLESETSSKITSKGVTSLKLRGYSCSVGQSQHRSCAVAASRPVKTKSTDLTESAPSQAHAALRSNVPIKFDFKSNCLFCGTVVSLSSDSDTAFKVATLYIQDTFLKLAKERNDNWGNLVTDRISSVIDLPAAEARYHQACSVNFRTNQSIPGKYCSDPKRKAGRPIDEERSNAFYNVIDWLENSNEESITVKMLLEEMKKYTANPFTHKYMKTKLEQHYGDTITFHEWKRYGLVVKLQKKTERLLDQFYSQERRPSPIEEKERIIQTAARLIREDIMSIPYNMDSYPCASDMKTESATQLLPPTLVVSFLRNVFGKDNREKIAGIGHAILQSARPRGLILPIPLGIAVYLHSHYASRDIIDRLFHLGFCVSYSETLKWIRNASVISATSSFQLMPNQFLQFVSDNVDDNPASIDGHNSIHCMGNIAAVSPPMQSHSAIIPRDTISNERIEKLSTVVRTFNKEGVKSFGGLEYTQYNLPETKDKHKLLDLLYKCKTLIPLKSPLWSGFMQSAFGVSEAVTACTVLFLPMIDLPPTDLNCVYSTLCSIKEIASKNGMVPVVTFDQSLWWNALHVLQSPKCDLGIMFKKLGPFHTLMNFEGCIGYIMSGSGLFDALETVYAGHTVLHMLDGKAISRALRGHQLVDLALNHILLADISREIGLDLQLVESLINDAMHSHLDLQNIEKLSILIQIDKALEKKNTQLKKNKTIALWVLYMELNNLTRQFLRAERLGDFDLHLATLNKMLAYFAACGHHMYTKSVHIYLQEMASLQMEHPLLYQKFKEGEHVLRRTNGKIWGGISCDQVIEQTLMRSLKSSGGLTRGTVFSQIQRNLFIFSRPAVAEITEAIDEVSKTKYVSSDQHKDVGQSRMGRDDKDYDKICDFFQQYKPFDTSHPGLRNIVTGVVANPSVNIVDAEEVGLGIVKTMIGKKVSDYTFKTKVKATNLSQKIRMTANGQSEDVDPALLFQRITAILLSRRENKNTVDLSDLFSYALSPYPAALARSMYKMITPPSKSKLVDTLKQYTIKDSDQTYHKSEKQFVLDGGNVLHKNVFWQKHCTFGEIATRTAENIIRNYGKSCVIVFDGYPDGSTTKDHAHAVRSETSGVGPDVKVTSVTRLSVAHEKFLNNTKNKQAFIHLLGDVLVENGVRVLHAKDDADRLIAVTAVEEAETSDVVVVGEDTDLIVLLWHFVRENSKRIFFKTTAQIWDINILVQSTDMKDIILLIHAFLGCDTTSHVHNIGKDRIVKSEKLKKACRIAAKAFYSLEVQKEDVESAGERFFLQLYGREKSKSLNVAREHVSMSRIDGKQAVLPHHLPPTQDAANLHSLRVYHQVHAWLGTDLPTERWGWIEIGGKYAPLMMKKPPAPRYLLEIVRCACKEDGCKPGIKTCGPCSCRKHGISCSLSWKNCNGISCHNSQSIKYNADDDDNDSGNDE